MQLLLDTYAFVWWNADDPALGTNARTTIAASETTVFVSAATTWEIAPERAKGKLDVKDDLSDLIERNGFRPLSIDAAHTVASAELPRHHRDPFDRLLVAQAQLEGLTLVTSDAAISHYDVTTLDASS